MIEKQVVNILQLKEYPEELIKYAIELLPEMLKLFGKQKTVEFFRDYKLIPRDRNGQNSGATYKKTKTIEFDWCAKNFHEALTVFIHEAGHAIGSLETNEDNFLMEGHEYRESFLGKIEEAVVSERQNELEYGELNYKYIEINTPASDEEFHLNDFKNQPVGKYTINNVFYKNLQIMLGDNRDLINKMMYAETKEEKVKICNNIIGLLQTQLSNQQFLKLKDCASVFTLNFSYHGDTETLFDYMKNERNFDDSMTKEKYKELLIKYFPKNTKYCIERNLIDKNIFDAIDDLCELTIDVLFTKLSDNEYDKFSVVKESCEYFSKIYNNSEKLSDKTIKLKNVLINKIKIIEPELIKKIDSITANKEETFDILTKIICKNGFKESDLSNIKIVNNNGLIRISVSDFQEYVVERVQVYPEGTFFLGDIAIGGNAQPISSMIVLKESDKALNEKNNNDYSR